VAEVAVGGIVIVTRDGGVQANQNDCEVWQGGGETGTARAKLPGGRVEQR
jgi:hypothetical protein